jgi:prepilin-type N-terminal cleavage/methylation domain-containing protein
MRARAFTLVELIIVIVILGIMAAVVAPSVTQSAQSRQRSAAQMLVRDLRYSQARAVATGRRAWVTVNPSTETVTYSEDVSGMPVAVLDQATGSQMTTVLGTAATIDGVAGTAIGTFNGSTMAATIGFDWQGRPLDSLGVLLTANQTITVTASGLSTVTVTIVAETGAVTITW